MFLKIVKEQLGKDFAKKINLEQNLNSLTNILSDNSA